MGRDSAQMGNDWRKMARAFQDVARDSRKKRQGFGKVEHGFHTLALDLSTRRSSEERPHLGQNEADMFMSQNDISPKQLL